MSAASSLKDRPVSALLTHPVTPVLPSDDVTAVPPRFVACRTLRHAWEPSDKVVGAVPVGLAVLGCQCLRCTTMRLDGIDSSGRVKYRRYQYPDGYLRKKGQAKLLPTDYRLQLLAVSLGEITMRGRR